MSFGSSLKSHLYHLLLLLLPFYYSFTSSQPSNYFPSSPSPLPPFLLHLQAALPFWRS